MKHFVIVLPLLLASSLLAADPEPAVRRISAADYVDRMKAGWLGQIDGVSFGAPTEFRWKGAIIPADKTPKWIPRLVNDAFDQDDLYVEMTFVRTLEQHGLNVSMRQAGIDWANSGYRLWHANEAGRNNLRKGIAPPDAGHPQFNAHADDIDYQIEADFSGLLSPGMPNNVIALGEKFGRLMNYGDGLYAGQFIGGLYAEAFFETDREKLVEAGLRCIPEQSQFAQTIRDVVRWHRENPSDWEKTWRLVEEKYQKRPEFRRFSCDKGEFNIDAKINGAYVVIGLLYGDGDIEKTMAIATRCGQDSDCNPSSAAGVLFTTIGFSKLPAPFKTGLDENRTFSYTAYTFPKLIAACEQVARQAVVAQGGRIEKDAAGQEWFIIPVATAKPSPVTQSWSPLPPENSRFTAEESKQITRQK